jgi:hypothetical protein
MLLICLCKLNNYRCFGNVESRPKCLILYVLFVKVVVKFGSDVGHRITAYTGLDREVVSEACKKFKVKIVEKLAV